MSSGARIIAAVLAFLALAACGPAQSEPRPQAASGAPPAAANAAAFDYYVLALSWSPAYCADRDNAARDPMQCDGRRAYAFVTHGLWPQYERGFPESCETRFRGVPDAIQNAMLDIMPSRGLIRHQWTKHGACTGLDQTAYFNAVRGVFQKVAIPLQYRNLTAPLRVTGAEVERAFLEVNPGMRADGIAVQCRGGRLREVRICFTRDGRPRACGSDVRDQCSGAATMLPMRGAPAR